MKKKYIYMYIYMYIYTYIYTYYIAGRNKPIHISCTIHLEI